MNVLGGYSKDVNKTVKTLVGERSEETLSHMQNNWYFITASISHGSSRITVQ